MRRVRAFRIAAKDSPAPLLTGYGEHIALILKEGRIEKDATQVNRDEHWFSQWFAPETPRSA